MRQTRMSGAMRGSQETKVMPKGPSLRACSLLYNMMSTTKSLIFAGTEILTTKWRLTRLLFALDARAGAFPGQLTQITSPQNIANGVRVRAERCDNSRSLVPVRIGLNKFVSSCCRYRPGVMLLRPQPADNNTQQGVSEAVDPLRRNHRGVQAPRGCVNRVPVPPTRSH